MGIRTCFFCAEQGFPADHDLELFAMAAAAAAATGGGAAAAAATDGAEGEGEEDGGGGGDPVGDESGEEAEGSKLKAVEKDGTELESISGKNHR